MSGPKVEGLTVEGAVEGAVEALLKLVGDRSMPLTYDDAPGWPGVPATTLREGYARLVAMGEKPENEGILLEEAATAAQGGAWTAEEKR